MSDDFKAILAGAIAVVGGYYVAEWAGFVLAGVCFFMGRVTEMLWHSPKDNKQRETVE